LKGEGVKASDEGRMRTRLREKETGKFMLHQLEANDAPQTPSRRGAKPFPRLKPLAPSSQTPSKSASIGGLQPD